MAAGRRRRSGQLRGDNKMAGAGGAELMKPRGRIRNLVKSGGHVVKPGTVESAVKPSSVDSAEEAWICVRECRIKRTGLRFNSQGDVYVPDSEDEEVAANGVVELAPAVAADGAAGVDLALPMTADGAAGVDMAPTVAAAAASGVPVAINVAADGAVGVEMNPEVAGRLAKKVLGEDLHPEVAARLAKVLADIEPFCHECFIDMYKVMVPLFFTPPL